MARFADIYVDNHRRQQSLLLAGAGIALLLSIAPREERALFITDGTGLKAFGAVLPPINPARLLNLPDISGGPDTPAAFFARTPSRTPAAGPAGASPAGPAFVAPAGDGPDPVGGPGAVGDNPFVSPAAAGDPGGLPFGPTSSAPPSASPVAPTTGATPTPVATPAPDPVAPAPEPATWVTLLVGFLAIGWMLRRRRRPVPSTVAG